MLRHSGLLRVFVTCAPIRPLMRSVVERDGERERDSLLGVFASPRLFACIDLMAGLQSLLRQHLGRPEGKARVGIKCAAGDAQRVGQKYRIKHLLLPP